MLDQMHFTGTRITICDGRNGPNCVEPIDVFAKQRDPRYQAAPGDPDYPIDFMEQKYEFPAYLSQ